MPQLLALEWDQFEARIVVAQQRGEDVRIDHAFSVELTPRDPGQTFADVDVGQRLESALSARRIGKAETLVAVGRSSIELRRLSLPPAPEDEWPELVRFQALPQFTNLGEDWPLDYFPLEGEAGEGTSVLAATISPQLVRQITETCSAAGLSPARLVLRPCAAASLLIERGRSLTHRIRLFVDLLSDEADLTVLVDRHVVLMRTVRLPAANQSGGDRAGQAQALIGEIRRTIASAQNQLGGDRVEQIVLCGNDSEHHELAATLADRLNLDVEHFDPFSSLQRSSELRNNPPQAPERFAPLLGMVVDEAASRRHAIDFLNPRKKAPPKSKSRTYAIAGSLAALVLLAVVAMCWMELAGLRSRNAVLSETSNQLDAEVEDAEAMIERVDTIESWDQSQINWLNELESISAPQRFPPAEDVRLINLKASPRPGGGGQMSLVGLARGSDVVPVLESMLRDERHAVSSGPSRDSEKDPRYPYRFQETVRIDPLAEAPSPDEQAAGGSR